VAWPPGRRAGGVSVGNGSLRVPADSTRHAAYVTSKLCHGVYVIQPSR
jgi:hypothetical protein